jgi:MFS family permease
MLLVFAPIAVGLFGTWKAMDLGDILKLPSSIGADNAPLVNLIQQLARLVFAKAVELIVPRSGTKPIMWFGSISILASGVLALATPLAYDGWWVIIFYVLAGLNWVTITTAFNAIVLDHFKGEQASVAFAAGSMQQFLGQSVFYFIGTPSYAYDLKAILIIAIAVPILPGLYLADFLKQRQETGLKQEQKKAVEDDVENQM